MTYLVMSLGKKKAPTIPVNKWRQKAYELGDNKKEQKKYVSH